METLYDNYAQTKMWLATGKDARGNWPTGPKIGDKMPDGTTYAGFSPDCLPNSPPAAIFNHMVYRCSESLDNVLGAIADPTRRAILQHLGKSPARVTEIARNFPVSLNAISKHIIVLQRAGLVRQEIRGRDRICSLNAQPLREASLWIEQMRGFWEERLDAFERHISAKRRKPQ